MIKHYINLDYIQQPILPRLWMKQNDNESHQIVASLYDNGVAYTPDSGVIPVFRARKPDGTVAVYDGGQSGTDVSLSGNVVTVLVAEQVLTVPGTVACEINLYSAAGDKLTTFSFQVEVQQSVVTDGEIVSSDYYNILSQQIAQAIDAADDAAQSAQEAAQSASQAANMIPKVSPTTAGNYPELTSNGTLTDSGIPARLPTPAEIGAVPTTRTVNGKALSSNITLDADDVGAVPIVSPATAGHLPALTAAGKLTDSGVVAENVATLKRTALWTGNCTQNEQTLTLSQSVWNFKRLQLLYTTNAYNNYLMMTDGSMTSTTPSAGWTVGGGYNQCIIFQDGTFGAFQFPTETSFRTTHGFDTGHRLLGIWGIS